MKRALVGVALLAVAAILVGVPYLLVPRDDEPRDPDAVVVLGGAGIERTELGIELSRRYGAELVLSSSAIDLGGDLGLACGGHVRCIHPEPETTRGEAMTVGELADVEGWGHVTVATSRFHTTRARTLFRQCLGDSVTVVGAPPHVGNEEPLRKRLREAVGTIAAWTVQRAC